MRILLAGDTHGNAFHLGRVFDHAVGKGAERIVQLGDFGYGWATTADGDDLFVETASQYAAKSGIPLYYIEGNHENFDALEAVLADKTPEPDGTYRMADGVYYIPRGTLLWWDGVRILCCGGATSVDKKYRVNGVSWWRQEEILFADVDTCLGRGRADILLTHDFPWESTVVDRHLDPYWGVEAQEKTLASRKKISRILGNCAAALNVHGHLHVPYTQDVHVRGQRTRIIGTNCDATPMHESTLLLDLRGDWKSATLGQILPTQE